MKRLSVVIALALLMACQPDDTQNPLMGTLEWDRLELVAEAQEPITAILVTECEAVESGQLLAGVLVFNVPIVGALSDLYLASLVFISATLSLGLVISTFARTQFQAMQLTFFTFLPSILLSGFMFPFDGMPELAQWVGRILPLTHFMVIIRGIVLKGAELAEVLPSIQALLLFFTVTMAAAILRFRKRLD